MSAELIKKLEEATGPSRELDAAVAAAVGAKHGPREYVQLETRSYETHSEIAAHYTASVDAALSLVPAKCGVHMQQPNRADDTPSNSLAYACVAPPGLGGPRYAKKRAHLSAFHHSLPIALCIAALKARSRPLPPGEQ